MTVNMDNPHSVSKTNHFDSRYWNDLVLIEQKKHHIDPVLGRYKSDEFIRLVRAWIQSLENKTVLKTDLREEAYGEDEILFSLSLKNSTVVGIDIAEETVRRATRKQEERSLVHRYITSDVRGLPFKDNVFDVILSTSTLDHFNCEDDFIQSLRELKRVLRPHGSMIITINNKCNLVFYVLLKLERLFGLTPYPVESFTPTRLKKIFNSLDLNIQNEDCIIHIISPINTILLLLRKFFANNMADEIAKKCVFFAYRLGNKKKLNLLTGWFIALKCSKEF